MVIIIKHMYIPEFLKIMKAKFDNYSLIFNAKKSAITRIQKHKLHPRDEYLLGIPYKDKYLYLGVWIDGKGTLEEHLEKMQHRVKYLENKLYIIVRELEWENKHLIWTAYIRPYFIYIAPIIQT